MKPFDIDISKNLQYRESLNAVSRNKEMLDLNKDQHLLSKDAFTRTNQLQQEQLDYLKWANTEYRPIPEVGEMPSPVQQISPTELSSLDVPRYAPKEEWLPKGFYPEFKPVDISYSNRPDYDPTFNTDPSARVVSETTGSVQISGSNRPSRKVEVVNPQVEDMANKGRRITIEESQYKPPSEYLSRSNFMMLVPSGKKDGNGFPLWYLEGYETKNGVHTRVFQSQVRTGQLGKDDKIPGGYGRAPNGSYSVAGHKVAPSSNSVGRFFIPITPEFSTRRSALGIHEDIGNDSTAGCLGLVDYSDLDKIYGYLQRHKGSKLWVTDR